ncbi:serine hydrolase [Neolewinella persica]|uniref:serine hydrolase n=1 Tax=Neolewinella persica TaxID=70998 RepID=UPI000381E630|nr:serine hydrolase [Neolewinella persica]
MRFLFSLFAVYCCSFLFAQTGAAFSGLSSCDAQVQSFLNEYDIPAASLAISRNGKLVYNRAFGKADLAGQIVTQPWHRFRVASVSKPLTSIGIMKLIEAGSLELNEKVFGPGSLLASHEYLSMANITDNRVYDVTVQHLLEHSGGWDRDQNCFPNPTTPYSFFRGGCDPIGAPLHITQTLGVGNPMKTEDPIFFLLEKGLEFTPGTRYAYSNIGYLVLGEIIEAVTGKDYETYMREDVFAPANVCDMNLGKDLREDRLPREVEYEGNGFTVSSAYGTGQQVPWEYGGWTIEAMGPHGGWVASAADLIRLLSTVDGFNSKPDQLSSTTINSMTTPSANANYYAKGWAVNSANNWWHTGALDGTASIMVRSSGGYNFALILNKRIIDRRSNQFWADLDGLPWSCIGGATSWPGYDLMLQPEAGVTNFTATPIQNAAAATVSYDLPTGVEVLIVASETEFLASYPEEAVSYEVGDVLPGGAKVVYVGDEDEVEILSLEPTTTYFLRAFPFRKNSDTRNFPLYRLCDATEISVTTSSTFVEDPQFVVDFKLFPNPTDGLFRFTLDDPAHLAKTTYRLYDAIGQELRSGQALAETALSLANYPTGLYTLVVLQDGQLKVRRVIHKQ